MHFRRLPLLTALLCSGPAFAFNACPGWDDPLPDGQAAYEVFASPYTHHWSHDPEHRPVFALALNRHLPDDRFCGLSLFRNSFGQPSGYLYAGKRWNNLLANWPQVYAQVSAGVIYGYVGQYKNKVPGNVGGFSPAIVPAVGYRLTDRAGLEVQILGTAAVMFGATWRY
ncbi:MAG: hypothetical protein IBJ04_12895 [Hydrogenophaga sp.]|uniref:Sn-glycerol-3-phosphate transporter n=1 Tax=Hydrogenophaga crocea TaxID=2716225 RepID=A0A6G8ICQ1_9BURK|nr:MULTISPECIES: hypothetical protein [Hydrogenophaga]MBL0945220.1 hypothetical protein [Hydrogenophaga sp.]QIM50909.1 hypothetical protein G9Q37_01575 [Hydrogenophaga crocea]